MQPATTKPNPFRTRIGGVLAILGGVGVWWYNWHHLMTTGTFYIKMTLIGPLALAGGVLMMFRPEWTGPLRKDSTRAHKTALISVIVFMAVGAGIDFYLLDHYRP
jgi:hypothetical protein